MAKDGVLLIQYIKNQKIKIINMSFVNNMFSNQNRIDNYLGLSTKGVKRDRLDLIMKRNKQLTNKGNTVLLK
jgi:hypothetical protein